MKSSKFANLLALFEKHNELQKSSSTANLCVTSAVGNRKRSPSEGRIRNHHMQSGNEGTKDLHQTTATELPLLTAALSTDSGKSSNSCSPTLLDYSFDSGVSGLVANDCCKDMLLHKRIQQFQRILLALERDRDHFYLLRQRLR